MNDLPWFSMYPADFLVSTAMMTPVQGWAYTQLLMYAWTNGGVPDDREQCANLTRCPLTEADWQAIRSRLVVIATPMAPAMATLSHPRMERERAEATERRRTAVENGKAGAEARWGSKNRGANGHPNSHPNGETMAATTTATNTNTEPPARSARSPQRGDGRAGLNKRDQEARGPEDPAWVPF